MHPNHRASHSVQLHNYQRFYHQGGGDHRRGHQGGGPQVRVRQGGRGDEDFE